MTADATYPEEELCKLAVALAEAISEDAVVTKTSFLSALSMKDLDASMIQSFFFELGWVTSESFFVGVRCATFIGPDGKPKLTQYCPDDLAQRAAGIVERRAYTGRRLAMWVSRQIISICRVLGWRV